MDQNIYKDLCRLRNQVRRITRKAQKLHEKTIVDQIQTNPKQFWSYAVQTENQSRNPGVHR